MTPLTDLNDAITFLDKVRGSTPEEKQAVGKDAREWIESSARAIAPYVAELELIIVHIARHNYQAMPHFSHNVLDQLQERIDA